MMSHIVTLVIGVAIGWIICTAWMVARLGRASVWINKQALSETRDAAEQARTDALLTSADAANDLALLACLDNGQVSDVRRALTYKLGLFYHRWAAKPDSEIPESIQRSLSAIRDGAKEIESVRKVLTHDPKHGPPPA